MSLSSRIAGPVRHLVSLYRQRQRRLFPEALARVGFDEGGIVCSYPDGAFRNVAWSEVSEVRIRTTSEGPFLPDVFWCVYASGDEPAVVYPQGATGDGALLEELQRRLVGFDNGAVISAMGCTDDAQFVAWRRGVQGLPAPSP